MQHSATYCPEDNKLRLYVGRVPRDEYETLRAAGFKSTPKQDCDFVAIWTPEREDIARDYLENGEDTGHRPMRSGKPSRKARKPRRQNRKPRQRQTPSPS
jgi:hypothetical protein